MLMSRPYGLVAVLLSSLAFPILGQQPAPTTQAADTQAKAKTFIDYFLPTPPHGELSRDAWGAPNVAPGSSTTVTLTATTRFDALPADAVVASVSPAASLITYSVKLGALPSWFTPTSIVCSAQIVPADCTVANFGTGLAAAGDPLAKMTVTVTVTGTAAPPNSADGTTGTASGQGCITGPGMDGPVSLCSSGSDSLPVRRSTPPPTSTAGGSGSSEGQLPSYLPFALVGFGGLLLVLRIRTQRRYSARP
jgi:hypothetical protein